MLEYPETTGNLLFAAADEEAYSAGMRGAVALFTRLGETDAAGRAGGIPAGEGTRLYNLLQKAAKDTCGLCLGKRIVRSHWQGCAPDVGAGARQESAGRGSSNFAAFYRTNVCKYIGNVLY